MLLIKLLVGVRLLQEVLFRHCSKTGEHERRLPGCGYRQQDHGCGICAERSSRREQIHHHRKSHGEMEEGNPEGDESPDRKGHSGA